MKKVVIILAIVLVLIGAIILFAQNSSSTYNISESFNIHGKVVDYGIIDTKDEMSIIKKIYETYKDNNKGTIYVVLGDKEEIKVSSFEDVLHGNINLIVGERNQDYQVQEPKFFSRTITPTNNKVKLVINGKDYEFDLNRTEKVYFVIRENE